MLKRGDWHMFVVGFSISYDGQIYPRSVPAFPQATQKETIIIP